MDESRASSGENRERRLTDDALAGSAPDPVTLLDKMVGRFMKRDGKFYAGRVMFAGLIVFLWVIAQFGVPALLAGQALIDKWLDFKTAERESVTPDALDRILRQGEQTQQAVQQTDLTVRALGEDIDRIDENVQGIDRRVSDIERAHGKRPQ